MKEIEKAVKYWSTVKTCQNNARAESGKVTFQIECNNELLRKKQLDGYVMLLGYFAAHIGNEGYNLISKKMLVDLYQQTMEASRKTAYKKINETIKAIDWFVVEEGKKHIIDIALDRYIREGIRDKVNGYIYLNETEMKSLLQTKNSVAIKLYLRLKQLNAISINSDNLKLRAVTITGPKGLAASLGYAPTNDRTINNALEILQEHKLIAFTGNQYKPEQKGKYILINAIMGDTRQRWISYNLKEYSSNYIVNSWLNIQTPDAFGNSSSIQGELEEIDVTALNSAVIAP